MRVIAIETSSTVASVAIVNDEKIESEIFINNKLQHSTILFPMIESILSTLSINMDSIDGVVVSGGPGSFTGLRIGVATAKGLVQGSERKFIGVSSLDSLAYQNGSFNGLMCPIVDALHDNVYTSLYKVGKNDVDRITDYDALHIDELIESLREYEERIIFIGDAVSLHREKIESIIGSRAEFSLTMNNSPRAATLGLIGIERLSKGIEDSIYSFGPVYIRKSQAEREYEKKHGKE
ncbi:tRNA (adenosine(37)-N6)-threonylcarbamoyltransferase complex dimerization subunit type 1 TsaB [Clostridium cylindrosporum]|uniref:tRNA threonylcarbamoyladenosine biosynthesis protein TsaB n=1 Tax=Clostridium cylindrosporum DSM 605 TaxID=1121307 RepID=A0A0J8DGN3_CLOCY|nr:tRNA (adenosine(37)-N6)-threonylcarbamoyltransferase complex dimerization subunit type 1 TsaB [Clostridium cylindrosporum]KMT23348.1 tRNA threonylcarbamoyladenosine biosynthesis protein TsaB [Clostridium cylindrosporum DSM 605]